MDLLSLLFVTAAVLGVLLLVLAIIAVVVLLPPVRRAMRERAHAADSDQAGPADSSEATEQQP